MRNGLLQIYTGDGKGKTTASLGLAMRAAGHGWNIIMVQFMKGRAYGELAASAHIPGFTIEQYGRDEFVNKLNPDPIDVELAQQGFARAKEVLSSGAYDLVILDEINVALDFALLPLDETLSVIEKRASGTEVICTGRYAPEALMNMADLITEMREVKHPYQQNIQSRIGIEF